MIARWSLLEAWANLGTLFFRGFAIVVPYLYPSLSLFIYISVPLSPLTASHTQPATPNHTTPSHAQPLPSTPKHTKPCPLSHIRQRVSSLRLTELMVVAQNFCPTTMGVSHFGDSKTVFTLPLSDYHSVYSRDLKDPRAPSGSQDQRAPL